MFYDILIIIRNYYRRDCLMKTSYLTKSTKILFDARFIANTWSSKPRMEEGDNDSKIKIKE